MIPPSGAIPLSAPCNGQPLLDGSIPSVASRLAHALQCAGAQGGPSRWQVRKLADGRQAHVFAVRALDESPLLASTDDAGELVVKVYRVGDADDRAAARDEFECLHRLRTRVDGTTTHGWTVRCPRPFYLCGPSATLVMTRVSGAPLSRHLLRGTSLPDGLLDSMCRATVATLQRYWAGELRLYGDLILDNVLCDVPTRTLTLVDPGMPEPFYVCDGAPRSWYPASRDLGFLLFWAASLLRRAIAHPLLHVRQNDLACRIVQTFLDQLEAPAERHSAMAEIEACARLHLGRIPVSASPKGLWRRLVKCSARRTLEHALSHLRETAPADANR